MPKAIYKPGIGEIDLRWGDKKGGLQHIIKRRNEQGQNGLLHVKRLHEFIKNGKVKKIPGRNDRIYIVDDNAEVETPIRLDYNQKKRKWVVSSFKLDKKSPAQAQPVVRPSRSSYADGQVISPSDLSEASSRITKYTPDVNPSEAIYSAINNSNTKQALIKTLAVESPKLFDKKPKILTSKQKNFCLLELLKTLDINHNHPLLAAISYILILTIAFLTGILPPYSIQGAWTSSGYKTMNLFCSKYDKFNFLSGVL